MLLKQKIKVLQRVSRNSMDLITATRAQQKKSKVPSRNLTKIPKIAIFEAGNTFLQGPLFLVSMLNFEEYINNFNCRTYIFFIEIWIKQTQQHPVLGDIWPGTTRWAWSSFGDFPSTAGWGCAERQWFKLGKEAKDRILLTPYSVLQR